ncbi:MAG TPA: RNA polymerase sigma factor [Verrucomicrobiota bacterium]|nr:RNA polymerase sigma factor [Verrucomicrobiota bacterium]HNU51514.1 RNA polymerase sigma factor [Verrucomicrobiota bacterium]
MADGREFSTTQWSAVVTAGDTQTSLASEALETLCRTYWPPLYAYARRRGYSPVEAQDLTQEFFARLFKKCVAHASPERGKFRTFLLTSFQHFLVSEWRKSEREKRGGGLVFVAWDDAAAEHWYADQPPGELPSEQVYEKRWAITLVEHALARLHDEYASAGKGRVFETLRNCIWGREPVRPYADLATELGVSEGAVKMSVHRLRQRCREVLRAEVTKTVAQPEDVDEELRHLIRVFGE